MYKSVNFLYATLQFMIKIELIRLIIFTFFYKEVNVTGQETIVTASTELKDSVDRMIRCLLWRDDRKCKYCKDVDVCIFLTKALFVYRTRGI